MLDAIEVWQERCAECGGSKLGAPGGRRAKPWTGIEPKPRTARLTAIAPGHSNAALIDGPATSCRLKTG